MDVVARARHASEVCGSAQISRRMYPEAISKLLLYNLHAIEATEANGEEFLGHASVFAQYSTVVPYPSCRLRVTKLKVCA